MPDAERRPRTCDRCRWWDREDTSDQFDDTGGYGSHLNAEVEFLGSDDPAAFRMHRCTSPLLKFQERPGEAKGATVIDGSGYFGALATAPQFGCVNWEATHA